MKAPVLTGGQSPIFQFTLIVKIFLKGMMMTTSCSVESRITYNAFGVSHYHEIVCPSPPPPPPQKKDAVCAIRLATPSYDDVMSYPLAG